MNIHHIGIKVDNIDKSKNIYEKIGYSKLGDIVVDSIQNNKILFMQSTDKCQKIELIESLNEKSSVFNFNNGLHHICYDVRQIENFLDYFKRLKIGKIFTSQIIAPAIYNRKIVFACLNNGCFVEFIL